MRCCVPFCKNTSDNIATSEGAGKSISFHGFPSEVHLRAAWLRALGKQDSHLPDSAVVCSQHFLNDDIYETESGLRQIVTGAIPSTVQVCMICLDTDSKLILMSKHKLEEAYEKLTGHPLYDPGNLKQTVCLQCAQRLINFSRFRDKSLRARALMMDLVEKHELITRRHIKMINCTKHQLKSNMVLTTLGPDHCDLHILEHPSEDKQKELEESYHTDVVKTEESEHPSEDQQTELEEIGPREVKTEESDDSMSVNGDMEVIHEDDYNVNDLVQDPLKNESAPFQCALCLEEFVYEHEYMQHISVHLQNGDGDGACAASQVCEPHTAVSSSSSHSSLSSENRQADPSPYAQAAQTTVAPPPARLMTNNEIKVPPNEEVETNISCRYKRLTDCLVKLHDIFDKKDVQKQYGLLMKTGRDATSCDSLNIFSKDFSHQATSQNEVPKKISFVCGICRKMFKQKRLLVEHINTHTEKYLSHMTDRTGDEPYTCKICNRKLANYSSLERHMRAHIGDQPYQCELCDYKCAHKSILVRHMVRHTGEKPFTCVICNGKLASKKSLEIHMRSHTDIKPYACELCDYKSTRKSNLVEHRRTHTGEKPYSCNICEYKFSHKCSLMYHMASHTGEKPFTCQICNYKFGRRSSLASHMKIHTGEKRFSCKLCNYKSVFNKYLVAHMRTHTGEKPYSCNICEYKYADSSSLTKHMRTHTGIKLYPCELCDYKSKDKSYLVCHMRTHTGEKPYSCELCEYKSAHKSGLISHMKTHTGEKPYSCNICEYKCADNSSLTKHMRTHTGVKPYACELCDYKSKDKSYLVCHMRTHTGEKPYSCELCEYKSAHKSGLISHMKTHTGEKPFS